MKDRNKQGASKKQQKQEEASHKQASYRLSSSFRSIHQARKNQTFQYIQQFSDKGQKKQESQEKAKRGNSSSLQKQKQKKFKFNLASSAVISEVPIQTLRKNSKSRERHKLESLTDSNQANKFSIFDHQQHGQNKAVTAKKRDPKEFMKKYNIDYGAVLDPQLQSKLKNNKPLQSMEQQQNQGMLKPSKLYEVPECDSFASHTIFQTPLLPCFASQFQSNHHNMANSMIDESSKDANQFNNSKEINEKEGVWKIGRIKIKGKKAQMKICDIQFEGQIIPGQGKAGIVSGDRMFQMKDWRGIWIMQPKDEIFL